MCYSAFFLHIEHYNIKEYCALFVDDQHLISCTMFQVVFVFKKQHRVVLSICRIEYVYISKQTELSFYFIKISLRFIVIMKPDTEFDKKCVISSLVS